MERTQGKRDKVKKGRKIERKNKKEGKGGRNEGRKK